MIHIKLFTESIKDADTEKSDMFWIINIRQPHLKLAFKYIGMNNDKVEEYFNMFNNSIHFKKDKILIFKEKDYWSFCGKDAINWEGIKHIDNTKTKNMCEIYITDEQAAEYKYNL